VNRAFLGWPRGERFKGTRDFVSGGPSGGWQEALATSEVSGVTHTANNTWEQITSMDFYARKGEVYLVRLATVGVSLTNNFDQEFFSLAIRTVYDAAQVLEQASNRYAYPSYFQTSDRPSSVNRSGDYLPRSCMFLLAGLPEGPVNVGVHHWDGGSSMDRGIMYMMASIRRVGLPQRKDTASRLHGWPLKTPAKRPSRLLGHAVDSSTRSLTANSTYERVTGTEIAFTPKPDHEYEYVAYVLCRGTSVNFDSEFFSPRIDFGDNAGYIAPESFDGTRGFNANPAALEPMNLAANAQTTNQRGLSLHGTMFDFQKLQPCTFALFSQDGGTSLDRELVYTSVVLLEAVPASYGIAA